MKAGLLYITSFLLLLFLWSSPLSAQIQRPVGTNLAGVEDWSSEFVFVDVMKQSRNWIAHELTANAPWSSGVSVPLRPDGYPLEIPYDNGVDPPQGIRTVMFADLENVFPSGVYRVMADGSGRIQFWGAASGTFQCPVDTFITVDNTVGILSLEILESEESDPVHNLRVVMPGFHDDFESHPFHPRLLDFLQDFQVIRFMDWMKTNGSPVEEWADRNVVDYFTQTLDGGVAYEYMTDLCNLLQKDMWVNIPHRASDDFIVRFARLLQDRVDGNLKIYIEYSNEVWNSIFEQHQYAGDAGAALGYTGQPWERAWKYTAKRSADVFQLFENEFADDSRLVKVIPAFAANSWVTNYILDRFSETEYNPTGIAADAVAIAPYFGGGIANAIGDAGLENSVTVSNLLDSLQNSLAVAYTYMEENKTVASQHGLDLIAYEGGQHLVAYYPYHNNDVFVEKLLDANRHPLMEELYCRYFDHWYEVVGGGVFAHFSSHGGYSKYGAWGVKETYEDIDAPKYLGLQQCVFSYNSPVTSVNTARSDLVQVYPVLVTGFFTVNGNLPVVDISVYDLNGVLQRHLPGEGLPLTISMNDFPAGTYFVKISDRQSRQIQVEKIIKQ